MQLPQLDHWQSKKQQTQTPTKPKKIRDDQNKSKGMVVVLPYVQGSSEKLQRVFQKHNIATGFRPNMMLRKSLVHPKDKYEVTETNGCVYELSCKNCDFTHVGETGRQLATGSKSTAVRWKRSPAKSTPELQDCPPSQINTNQPLPIT